MTGLDIFAFLVMAVIVASVIVAAVFLGAWPGKIAASRNHPQKDAINVCGWIGTLTLGLFWPAAMIWAHTKPNRVALVPPEDPNMAKDFLDRTPRELNHPTGTMQEEPHQSDQTRGGTSS